MKATGIVRRIDDLGRISLPKEIRDKLNFTDRQPIEMFMDGDNIVLRKYEVGCKFCGEIGDNKTIDDINICSVCATKVMEAFTSANNK